MDERDHLICLSLSGLYYSKSLTMLLDYFGSFQALIESDTKLVEAVTGKDNHAYHAVSQLKDLSIHCRREKLKQVESEYEVITLLDDAYPTLLREIYDPPWVIYCKGKALSSIPMIGMVGSRKATTYGKWAAAYFSRELAVRGLGVVSGLAYGIDAASHQSCLDAGGYSIGVLGGGIDGIYPMSNRQLYAEMETQGTILSEYGPGVQPQKHFFPARNRIISGLSLGTFVVEAGEKSGALITAEFAMEQGREVYALPGNINSTMSSGTNQLLRDGARMVLNVNDIIDPIRSQELMNHLQINKVEVEPHLSAEETAVMAVIREEPVYLDALAYKCGMTVSQLNGILTILELKGLISQHPGKLFTASM